MESLKKLREYADMWDGKKTAQVVTLSSNLRAYADAIEAELAERYAELPVDVDGAPIRIDDELVLQEKVWEKPSTVESITWDGKDWYFTCYEGFFNVLGWKHGHKPTVLDTLLGLLNEYREGECVMDEGRLSEYAEKLRLVGEDE